MKSVEIWAAPKCVLRPWISGALEKHLIWLVWPIMTLNTLYLIRVANHNTGYIYTSSNSWSQSEHRICFIQHVWLTVLFSCSWRGENYGRLLFMGISFTTAPDICPPGWMHWNNTCYYFANNFESSRVAWQDARQACQRIRGGDLASIHSAAENDFITRHVSG